MTETINRDAEFFKIQVYADRTHAILTIWSSLAFVIFGLLSVFYALFYEGVFSLKITEILTGWEGIVIIIALVFVTIGIMAKDYSKNSRRISNMIEAVNEGHRLPALIDLPKWKKTEKKEIITKKVDSATNETNMGEQHQNRKDIWLVVWGIGVAFLIQVIYDGFGFYGKSLQTFIGVAIAAVLLLGLAIYAVRNFNKKR
jgi:hypothetical protein